ncbi:MAG: DNA internalization-related competence protein ComEC/Rec2 [Pseudohongiellaceae bacterium]
MRSWMIAFSLGVIVCSFIPKLPAQSICYSLMAVSVLLHHWSYTRLPAAFSTGCSWLLLYASFSMGELLTPTLENQDLWVQGVVWSMPQQTDRAVRFEFMVEKLCPFATAQTCDFGNLTARRQKVLINVYQNIAVQPGQRWQLQLRLRRPHGFANPGGFDYEAWLMQQQIRATGYVREHPDNRLLVSNTGQQKFNRLRASLANKLANIAAGTLTYEPLIRALTIGDGNGITADQWDLFTRTGTTHLMVISGSHVSLIALIVYQLARWLFTRLPSLLLRFPAPPLAAVVALSGAFIYTGLAGFSLPAQRAMLMVAVYLIGILCRRQTAAINALSLALALILMVDPLAAQNVGFWLSFCAVAILLFSIADSKNDLHPPSLTSKLVANFWELVRTQLLMFSGLLPLMLIYFHQISLSAPFINMLAIPFIGLLVVPLCLLSVTVMWIWPTGSLWLMWCIDYLLKVYLQMLTWVNELIAVDVLQLPTVSTFVMILICILVLIIQFTRSARVRLPALVMLPVILFWPRTRADDASVRLTVLDVGQGLAVVVSTRNHHLLYDAGPAFSSRFDAGSDVVVPYLQSMNISRLDNVIISHADSDHAGGLKGIVERYPTAHYFGSDTNIFPDTVTSELCKAGQHWEWDTVNFEILHPDAYNYSDNNLSCVLKIKIGNFSILLPGDIEKLVERSLVQKNDLKTSILIAPHHGSSTSSSQLFINALQPDYVVFSSGYLNRFKHPTAVVQARYHDQGTQAMITASSGAITFTVPEHGDITVNEYRRSRQRFWSVEP